MSFSVGQYVELLATVPAADGGSHSSGTRGIVEAFGSEEEMVAVAVLDGERRTGEVLSVPSGDLAAG